MRKRISGISDSTGLSGLLSLLRYRLLSFVSISLPILACSIFLVSCAMKPEMTSFDNSFLEEMGTFKAGQIPPYIYNTPKGFSACLNSEIPEWSEEKHVVDASPLQGIYYGKVRVLAGWQWEIEIPESIDIDPAKDKLTVRPDYMHRPLNTDGFGETIILDQNRPLMLIDVEHKFGAVLEYRPRFDFRPKHQNKMDCNSEFFEAENVVICSAGDYGYIAIATNGKWIYSPSEERAEYTRKTNEFDNVATHYLPGTIVFESLSNSRIAYAWSRKKEIAKKIALESLPDFEIVKKSNEESAMQFFNSAPLLSSEKDITYALNWDRWTLNNFNYDQGIASVKGSGSDGIGFNACRYAPAWFWASGGDTLFEKNHPGIISLQDDGFHTDYEKTALSTAFWLDYLELAGREDQLSIQFDSLQIVVNELDWFIGENQGGIPVPFPGRWEKKFAATNNKYSAYSGEYTIGRLWNIVLDRLKRISNKVAKNNRRQLRDIAYKNVPMAGIHSPINKSLNSDPFIWTQEEFEFVNEALANPDFNLGFIENTLVVKRDEKQYEHYAVFADRLFKSGDGLAYRDITEIKNIVWNAPFWSLQNFKSRVKGISLKDYRLLAAYLPAELYYLDKDSTTIKIPGGALESIATASERIRYFYETLAGVSVSPKSKTIMISPVKPLSAWKGQNITLTVSINNEKVQLFIDPANSMYQVKRDNAGKQKLKVSVNDLFDDGVALSGDVLLSGNGNFIIHRGIADNGKSALFIDGAEIKGTERRFHER